MAKLSAVTEANIRRFLAGRSQFDREVCTQHATPTTFTMAELQSAITKLKALPPPEPKYNIFVLTNSDAGAVISTKDGIEVALSIHDNRAVFDKLEVGAKSRCGTHTITSFFKEPVYRNELPSILSNRRSEW